MRIASAVPIGLVSERRQIISALLERLEPGVDPWFVGNAYCVLGNLAFEQADWAASSECQAAAVEQFLLAGSARDAAWATYFGCIGAWGTGDLTKAEALVRQAVDGFRRDGDTMGLGYALGDAAVLATDLDEAHRLITESEGILRGSGAPMGLAHTVEWRGIIAYDRNELADAAAFVAEAIELFSRYGNVACCAHALDSAAVIVARDGQLVTANELLSAADEFRRETGVSLKPWESRARYDIEEHIAPLSPVAHEAALTAGRQHTLESAARAALDVLSTAARE